MTVSRIYTPDTYSGNGVTKVFTITFSFLDNDHLLLFLTETTTGTVTPLNVDVDFTATGAGSGAGGTATLVTAPPTGYVLTLALNMPLIQGTSFEDGGPLPAASLEEAFDYQTMLAQQLQEQLSRAFIAPATFTGSLAMPAPIPGYALASNPTGTAFSWVPNTSASQLAQLADTTNAANGAGLSGFNATLSYAAGTVGNAIKNAVSVASIVAQTFQAFTTTGTSTAYVLTPSPAIGSLVAGQRFRVKFHVAGGINPTIAISGLTAVSLNQYDSTGAKVPASLALGQLTDIEYDGTDAVVMDPLAAPVLAGARNLKVSTTGLSAVVRITAEEIIIKGTGYAPLLLTAVSQTVTMTVSGAGGLDTGTVAAGSFYYFYLIAKPDGTRSAIVSGSSSSPTMPPGYTHKALVSAIITDGTANKYPLRIGQAGNKVHYQQAAGSNVVTIPALATGAQGNPNTPVWVAVSVLGYVPPIATALLLTVCSQDTQSAVCVSPNASYGAFNSIPGPAAMLNMSNDGSWGYVEREMALESTNIYYAATKANSGVYCNGYVLPF